MSLNTIKSLMACALIAGGVMPMHSEVTLNIDAASRGSHIGNLQYGIFYEEINNAGDGGLYGELLRNRSFEDGNMGTDYWSRINDATLTSINQGLLNDAQQRAVDVTLRGANAGMSNTGYWGINCVAGDTYTLSFWLKSDAGYKGLATASLVDADGTIGAICNIDINANGTWKKYTATMPGATNLRDAKFNLVFNNAGTVQIDMVSLFPPTYKDRPNGCRRDLAQMLEALKPAFVRFPGGCYIEGDGTVEDNRRFEWKKTIGPVEERPGHYNYNWGYPSTDGLGFHEFLQLTEDLGAEPLFVVNIGIGHGWYTDYTDIDKYITEALDAIEYCNGDVTTTWGAKRAANGHPEPFNLRLLEIGNENYNFDDDRSDHYAERYKAFYDAIKSRYPEITLIGNVEAWGTDNPSWRNSYHCEIVDEHYYRSPEWFEMAYNKYDVYDRSKPKVYVGEYAVTQNFGTNGHLRAALGEAVYMLGMERNSDHVIMSSYAPIFMNEERGGGWMPDMIRFSHSQSYGTPSYWVQQLMPSNHGKQNVKWTEEGNLRNAGNKVALSTWSTQVRYDNVKITDVNGNVVFSDDFTAESSTDWTAPSSTWTRTGGQLSQGSSSEQGRFYLCNVALPGSYTYEVDATKVSGAEGFLIAFNYADNNNYCWWNIGGWNNGQHGLQICRDGGKTDVDLKAGRVETGVTYHIKIVVDGSHVVCSIDDNVIHDLVLPVDRNVYVATSIDDDAKTMYVKMVNTGGTAQPVNIKLANASISDAEVIMLTASSATAENTTANPTNVVPTSGSMQSVTPTLAVYNAPAYSLSIVKLKLDNINYSVDDTQQPTPEQVSAINEELKPTRLKLNFLHASTALPVNTASGATIEWNLKEPSARVALTSSRFSSLLEVISPNKGNNKELVATLVASVTYPDGRHGDIEFEVNQAPADGMHGYLYAFMNPASEITNFALGTKESLGKKFSVLLGGAEAFDTKSMAPVEGGTRDSYLSRGERDNEYFMTVTDMSNIKTGMWNNHALALLRSTDLIHWETTSFDFNKGKSIFSDPEATVTDGYATDAEYAKIDRVWAPQFIWDPTAFSGKGGYLVYYSLLSSNPGDTHDRMFYSYADADFKTLTQPRLFYDPGYAVIDADIVLNPYDNLYHMMIKKEGANANDRGIFEYTSPALLGQPWTQVMHMTAEGDGAVEGPTHVRRIDEDIYNLYYMRYDNGNYKYRTVDLNHLAVDHSSSSALAGDGNFQHGSIITIDETEYTMLDAWSNVILTLDKCKRIKDEEGTTVFDAAIAQANEALANTTVESLAEALPAALQALLNAHGEYIAANPDDYNDITDQLTNPDFNGNSGTGWSGTSFTAANGGVAEQWNKNFDTYQILKNMPAGYYRLEVQGFYRYGYQAESLAAHRTGTEKLLANYYINDKVGTFMSLYDENYSAYPDNVWQANDAFNKDDKYHNTPVKFELAEMGNLRIGVSKTQACNGDWCCFDNFKLYYKPFEAGVDNVLADGEDPNAPVNVYSTTGALIRANVARDEAVRGLAPGIYLVGSTKVVVK